MRRILTIASIILGIVVLVIVGYFTWQYLIKKSVEPKPQNGLDQQEEILALPITEERIFDYWINKTAGEAYYISENDSQIFRISSSGEKIDTGSKAIGNLSYIKPSADGSKVLIAFGYPNTTFAIYDTNAKNWLALPAGTTAASWHSNLSGQIAYLRDNGAGSRLSTLNLLTGKVSEVLRISQKDIDLDWANPDIIYFKERPSTKINTSIWAYNLKNKSFSVLAREEKGLILKWLKGGELGLKLSGGLIGLVDGKNQPISLLELITLPEKCAFSSLENLIYCAAPEINAVSIDMIKNLPDEYLKGNFSFKDIIYALSATDRVPAPIIGSTANKEPIDAIHLEIVNGNLYFLNRYDNKLYEIEL